MCGILGYEGALQATPLIFKGLKQLSYRGYDSWGICAQTKKGLQTFKRVGDITKSNEPKFDSTKAIGHTRWATHGKVTQKNAHPHLNESGTIAVVHNGIIENADDLRLALEDEGYKFKSETDTEVIPHLLDYFAKRYDDHTALLKTLKHLKGSYAFLALLKGRLAFARDGSPLVIGLSNSGKFISSDIPSFLHHTRKTIVLEDGDWGFADEDRIYSGKEIVSRPARIESWDVEVAKKGTYPHFMLKEIEEQQMTIRKALNQDGRIKIAADLLSRSEVYILGCGTSYNTGAIASYELAKAGIRAIPSLASEFEPHLPFINEDSIIIALSQSGETKDVIDAVREAKKKQAKIISIVNTPGSTLAREADIHIPMKSGPEICVLSTKSATAQLAILSLLTHEIENKSPDLLREAAACAPHVIAQTKRVAKQLAKKLKDTRSIFTIGRGPLAPLAREAALKIKEVSYIHAEGMPAGELKHGPIALIEPGVPVIVFADSNTRTLTISNALEVKARGAYVIGIDSKNHPAYDTHIQIPDIEEATPMLALLPIQLLSYYLALERGCDPDKPRNLAKSVTVR